MVKATWRQPPPLIPLETGARTSDDVLAIHLTFNAGGWATFYIDDARGTLAVVSDWGSWSHRWGRGPWLAVEPPCLSRALAENFGKDVHYVAKKLCYGVNDEYDARATRVEVLSHILQRRREGTLTQSQAREAWDYAELIEWEHGPYVVAEELNSATMVDVMGCEYYEFIEYTPPTSYFVLREQLLPRFHEALQLHFAESEKAAAS